MTRRQVFTNVLIAHQIINNLIKRRIISILIINMKQRTLLMFVAILFVALVVTAQTHNVTRKPTNTQSTTKNNNKPSSTIPKTGTQARSSSGASSQNKNQQAATTSQGRQGKRGDLRSQSRMQSGGKSNASSSSHATGNPIIDRLLANMVYVAGGTFTMGATSEQGPDADSDESPTHQVTLSSFSIGRYEVTQEEWRVVMDNNPSKFKGDKRPVENVSWDDCQEFIRKLNAMTGKIFRLPTEAEWEFAARGGNNSRGYKYAGSNDIYSVAWYSSNSYDESHPVGQKDPNELGLYDMAGNVWEWCSNWKGNYPYSSQTNPIRSSSDSFRVFRGGSWYNVARYCRVSNRNSNRVIGDRSNTLGLRLAL